MEKKKEVEPNTAIKRLPFFYLGIGIIFGFIAYAVHLTIVKPENDLFNATALVIEAGIAISITWTVYVYSKKWNKDNEMQQKQITTLIEGVDKQQETITSIIKEIKAIEYRQQKIIEEQEEFKRRRHDWAINGLKSYLPELKSNMVSLDADVSTYNELPKQTQEAKSYELVIEAEDLVRDHFCEKIDKVISQSIGILDPALINEIQEILKLSERKAREVTAQGIQHNLVPYKTIIQLIDTVLRKLPNIII